MPNITSSYNGWSPQCRSVRGTKFYHLLDKGEIERSGTCSMCGVSAEVAPLQFHGEEYGPTWEDYLAATHEICCHCHGMIHTRFRYPKAWKMYIHAIHNHGPQGVFFNMGAIFNYIRENGEPPITKLNGVKNVELPVTGNAFIDNMPEKPYKGDHKMPMRWTHKGNIKVLAPDWDCLTDEQRAENEHRQLTLF